MNKIRCFSFLFLLLVSFLINAQTPEENQKKYLYGRDLVKEGRYAAASQVFLPLTAEASHNAYAKPASYFYALSSLKSGELESAKSMCLQVLQRYQNWEQKDEIYYLLSSVYFEQGKYRLALQFLNKIEGLKKDSEEMEVYYLSKATLLDTLKAIQKDTPKDLILAKIVADKLVGSVLDEQDKMLLSFLIQEYKMDVAKLYSRRVSSIKQRYNVALLLPFQLNDIDAKLGKRGNQYILDFYEGVRMALDTLMKEGVEVNLYSYDTEKELSIINSILSLPEMKSMDMIIGPVFPLQMPSVADFAKKNAIVNISPFSANSKIIDKNEFAFLFQPTLEVQAGSAVRYASENFKQDSLFVTNYSPPKARYKKSESAAVERKNVLIFFGSEIKDSLLAAYYRDSCIAQKLVVTKFEKITRSRLDLLRVILGDSIKLSKCNHVFASISDEVVAANIVSLLEISRQNTPLITRSDWLFFNLISFEQFEKRNVFFIHTDYYDYGNPLYKNFKATYLERTQLYPSLYSVQGFELTMYFTRALSKYGTYFKYGLNDEGFSKGMIFQGFDFANSFTNKYVPLTRFKDKNLIVVNQK